MGQNIRDLHIRQVYSSFCLFFTNELRLPRALKWMQRLLFSIRLGRLLMYWIVGLLPLLRTHFIKTGQNMIDLCIRIKSNHQRNNACAVSACNHSRCTTCKFINVVNKSTGPEGSDPSLITPCASPKQSFIVFPVRAVISCTLKNSMGDWLFILSSTFFTIKMKHFSFQVLRHFRSKGDGINDMY